MVQLHKLENIFRMELYELLIIMSWYTEVRTMFETHDLDWTWIELTLPSTQSASDHPKRASLDWSFMILLYASAFARIEFINIAINVSRKFQAWFRHVNNL